MSLSRWVLCVVAIAAGSCGNAEDAGDNGRRPNIVFFLVDDLGWADVACYGSEVYQTPNIDELAERGVRFTNAYASHPMCKASRFAVMMGKHATRERSSSPMKKKRQLPGTEEETTLAEALREGGYTTFFAGKWHLEKRGATPRPETMGFDVSVGVNKRGEPATYFFPYGSDGDPASLPDLVEAGEEGEYLTDRLTDEAIRFIEANRERPFFVYLSHYAVHKPLEGKEELVAKYEEVVANKEFPQPAHVKLGKADQKLYQDNPTYAAMVESVDESLGRLIQALERLGLSEDTIVVFTSDNGGDSCNARTGGRNSTSNVPLKAGKFWLYEGGIRVPLIVSYPREIGGGVTRDVVVTGTDHYPTLLELAGLEAREEQHVDGVSFASLLRGATDWEREAAFWHFPIEGNLASVVGMPPGSAIREGDYKLIEWYESGTYELYDLSTDIGEEHDLKDQQPEKARELLTRLRAWREKVDAPR